MIGAFIRVVLVGVALLALLNGAVRVLGGGEPGLLAPTFVREKASALAGLAHHVIADVWSPCAAKPERIVARAARKHRVPVDLALAVARTESDLRPHRISAAGAMGLMQLMPGTARDMGVRDPFDVEQSIEGGVKYLAWLLARYDGDRKRAIAAYNAGPGVVSRRGPLVLPRETRVYVTRVEAHARAYASAVR